MIPRTFRKASQCAALAVLGWCAVPSSPTIAQPQASVSTEKPVFIPEPTEKKGDRPQGWSHALTLAANLNVASNRDVVGQIEGNSFLFGASILAGANYAHDRHELLNSATLTEAWSRTPTIDRIVKSNDLLDLQTLYNYFVNPYTGPFARVSLQTSLFKTERHTAGDVAYVEEDVPGAAAVTTDRLRLSDSFQPLTISESLGWFVQPLRSEPLNVSARAGFGGRHTFADGARAITGDDDDAPMGVTYIVLEDVHQAGAELFAGFDGKQADGRLLYSAGLSVLFPFLNNDDTDRSILELTRVTLAGAVGMGVVSWLSINYQLKVVRDFQLIDEVQVQNSLLFSLQYTRASSNPAAEKKKAEEAAKDARIAELEARVSAAEARATAAETTTTPPAATVPVPPPPTPETTPDAQTNEPPGRAPVPTP